MMPIRKLFQSLIFPGQNLNLHVSHVAWSGLNLSGYYRSGGSVGVAGAGHRPGGGGRGGTAIYELYRYVLLGRVWFSSSLL